jgi:hypothetical protein
MKKLVEKKAEIKKCYFWIFGFYSIYLEILCHFAFLKAKTSKFEI